MSYNNFTGDISVYGLSIRLGNPDISSDKQKIEIPYIGVSSPSSSTVILSKYQYSLDNGVSYQDMAPLSPSDTTDLSFTESGSSLTFTWDAKKDLGSNLYNTPIRILLQASEFGLTSTEVTRYFNFERFLVNAETLRAKKPFPDSYQGISGQKFLQEKLPKRK